MNILKILGLSVLVGLLSSGGLFAANEASIGDSRLIGSWKFNNGFGIVIFHTNFVNGDFKRSIYDHGKLRENSKGRWHSENGVFHIVILRSAVAPNLDRYRSVELHIDEEIIDITADTYVVHEASFGRDGLVKWIRLGSPDISQFEADEPNQLPDPTPPSVTPPARAGGAPSDAADH